ncbi:MAG: hypothetical protein GXX85_17270 [Ignavibacteria bacterium]|nr:hypothetical protein [Ignavibacteria bacterium]
MKEDQIFLELLNAMSEDEIEHVCKLLSLNNEEYLLKIMVSYLLKYRLKIPSL